jgi:hypothetical protein
MPHTTLATIPWHLLTQRIMTALNIRKNLASILVNTAAAVENAKVPTKEGMTEKLNEYRIRAAALIMPKDCELHINC